MADKPTILCIEDEEEMIELITLILTRHNYNVVGALGGQAGLDGVRKLKPDLVLLDLMMPEIDGWELLQRVRADPKLQQIPVIVVTARASEIDRIFGLQVAGVEGYITKPFGPEELVQSVRRVLQARGSGAKQST
ncbi:MAG TPA: response regulator [Anaerolineae bacterium]|jgi:DNA-binding response OmpR family regulator|nr:response regulator [Anaerolineae bacterium]